MMHRAFLYLLPLLFLFGCAQGDGKEKNVEGGDASGKEEMDSKKERTSKEAIEAGIRGHIKERTEEGDGYFRIEKDGEELALKLVRVHTEYIANLAPERHFVCVDLAEESGDVYDVDFFLEGKAGDMKVTQTTLHKLNGRPFYTWAQKDDGTWHRVPVDSASKGSMGVIEGEDSFRFRYEAEIPEIEGEGELWMPIATSDKFQDVEMRSLETPGEHRFLEEKKHGGRILYLQVGPEHSGQSIEVRYDVERKEKSPYSEEGTDPSEYLSSSSLLPVGGRFDRIAERILKGKHDKSSLMKARAIYDHVIDTMAYQKVGKYGTGDADFACDSRSGNCTEFHSLFISIARSAGIPARFAIGASIPSSRDEGGISGYHCWAEFHAEGKWWPVDLSEANKYEDLRPYYFGHHPANRIELSKGRDLEVDPAPSSGPIEFLAYPLLEVDGKRVPVESRFSFQRKRAS